ncbi:Kelch repeat-containing protein [Fulvia fulva]|uniref:Kelch repeat-containing protein n=1 Tax=Passalora fulva TaxID=5499 RepID=A0A9Q8LFD4_PASFU|nr:Kelch repeat-containing protein [Fulvia fulva]KAK4626972.1 Kelch repeat-containing protein [Fulvia fulva]KAK4627865.1 Kelch repeat-containing protein [Fulvia fulva]UJO16194.1 Kelch repeat-containing protein [Fulvia fulva]WPV13506.1 Kelch repeat-containing protein [Fulvia fulva]WPV28917.1 Kelch repeat-containing protein [Fulvia fulva]
MQSSVITYDMTDPDSPWRKMQFYDDTPRAEGAMFYIPASDAGMLVYFGGVQQNASGNYTGVPMDTIYLYDIGAARWFAQQTSGRTPPPRRRFCGGVSWPEDRSSYNIYFFGGALPYDETGTGYGDVWILSLPSFTWTLYWPDAPENRHHSLSCDVINKGQMIVMGGYWPNSSIPGCDVPAIWGMHNLNLGSDNAQRAAWYQYLPNLTDYTVPPNLTVAIGGNNTGGATLVTPAAGFSSSDLGVYLARKATTSTRTATRPLTPATSSATSGPGGSGSNTGAIAGGVVGGVVGLALIAALLFFCLRRRKRAKANTTHSSVPAYPTSTTMTETSPPHVQPYHNSTNKQDLNPQTTPPPGWQHPPSGSPQQQPQQTIWQPVAVFHQPQNAQHFREDLPQQQQLQQFFPPPPQPQQHYPPPPDPQQYVPPSPTYEMPNVRSPDGVGEMGNGGSGGASPRAWRSPSAGPRGVNREE